MAHPRILVVELPVMLGPEARAEWVVAELRGETAEAVEQGAVNFGAIGSLARFKPARWVGVLPASVSTVMGCDLPATLLKQNKLQAALEGALEDKVLGDIGSSALACAPEGIDTLGRIKQAAATKRDWLDKLVTQSKAQHVVWHAMVPEAALLRAGEAYAKPDGSVLLCSPQGDAASLPAEAPLIGKDSDWTPLDLEPQQWLAQAAASKWNVLQGDFGPKARSAKLSGAIADLWQRGLLKPALWALVALIGVSVLGVNAKAWQLKQQITERKEQQKALLKRAAPKLDVVVDAPVQLKRELNALRSSTGQPNVNDVEAMLSALNSTVGAGGVWQRVEGKPGELAVSLQQAPDPNAVQALKSRGYQAQMDAGSLRLRSAP